MALVVKNPLVSAGDLEMEVRSPGEGQGNPLQYPCLEKSMDSGAWQLQSMGSQRVGQD